MSDWVTLGSHVQELLLFDIEGGMDASHLRHSNSTPMRPRRPADVVTHGREVNGGL